MAGNHTVTCYHRVGDPYAHLLVQLLPALAARFDIRLEFRLVPESDRENAPEPALLTAYGVRDAVELARYYDLAFDAGWRAPQEAATSRATRILAAHTASEAFPALAAEVGRALWAGDAGALARLADRHGSASSQAAAKAVAAGGAELAKRGHYQAAMLHYAGEWYWGIDRIGGLEERLRDLGIARGGDGASILRRRPAAELPGEELAADQAGKVRLAFYPSFRSPYTYLALDRVLDLAARYPVALDVKPVLPMLMRGLPVPKAKQMYILGDVAREARRLAIPFGNWCDPLGPGVERAMAVYPYAVAEGRTIDFLRSLYDGIWTEALDAAGDEGLRIMVERAGLDWKRAGAYLEDEGWREMAAANQRDLGAAGLWGVPSFVLGPYAAWGQDRLWIVEEKLKAHFG